MNMSLIIIEGKYGAIDTDDSLWQGYSTIKFSSSPYTLQVGLSIDGQVISSGKIVCEVTYYFTINILILIVIFYKNKSINTIVYLREIINGNVWL